jgi:selenocysteine lyase/cysteine desulfurase
MSDLIDKHKPKLVCVTHVPTNSGLEQNIQAIGGLCRDADTIYLVDACQSVGQMPLDVVDIGCDFLSATSRKFLRGPRGSGFLYVSDKLLEHGLEPLFIDMRGANWTGPDSYEAIDSAKRFETWEFAWANVLGMAAAAAYASDIGLETIRLRVQALVHRLREGLSKIDKVNVLGADTEVCGIVTATIDKIDPFKLVRALRAQGVNVSAQGREYAVIDYDRKKVTGALRLSPHYYNTEIEIDGAVSAIRRLVR